KNWYLETTSFEKRSRKRESGHFLMGANHLLLFFDISSSSHLPPFWSTCSGVVCCIGRIYTGDLDH
ncbi:hypothetical protein JTE90_027259, partial [Oedothorax gibbosus]